MLGFLALVWHVMQGPACQATVGSMTPQELQLHRADPPQCQQTPFGPHSGIASFGLTDLFHSPRFISSISRSSSLFITVSWAGFNSRVPFTETVR
jgi:hypothetical protein